MSTSHTSRDKKRGKTEPGRFRIPGFDIPVERPAREFPTLELDGVKVCISPAWNRDGRQVGWCIDAIVPNSYALEAIDGALAYALDTDDTADMWDDLNPAHYSNGDCMLMRCDEETVERFIAQAKRNGFKVAADDGGENTNKGNNT